MQPLIRSDLLISWSQFSPLIYFRLWQVSFHLLASRVKFKVLYICKSNVYLQKKVFIYFFHLDLSACEFNWITLAFYVHILYAENHGYWLDIGLLIALYWIVNNSVYNVIKVRTESFDVKKHREGLHIFNPCLWLTWVSGICFYSSSFVENQCLSYPAEFLHFWHKGQKDSLSRLRKIYWKEETHYRGVIKR